MSTKHTISMKDAALAFTLRKTVSDRVAAEVKTERTALEDRILTRMKEEGVKQTIVTLPDGTPVATLTVTQPSRKTETDDAALLAWAKENHPEWVETIEHPAQEAWTEERIDAAALKAAKLQPANGGVVVTADGEEVQGMTHHVPAPTSFSTKYADGGAQAVLDAYLAGELSDLPLGDTLPRPRELPAGVPVAPEAEEADVISGEEIPAQVPTPEEAPDVPWEQPAVPWDDAPIGFTTNTKEN